MGPSVWFKDSGSLSSNVRPTGLYNMKLDIKKVQEHNEGYYLCYGTYSDSTQSFLAKAELKIDSQAKGII